jgi:hypothetical protein
METWRFHWDGNLPSGKHTKNYRKSPVLMGKLTISMAIFNSYVSHYQRVMGRTLGSEFWYWNLSGDIWWGNDHFYISQSHLRMSWGYDMGMFIYFGNETCCFKPWDRMGYPILRQTMSNTDRGAIFTHRKLGFKKIEW